jgi:hypothetical protein
MAKDITHTIVKFYINDKIADIHGCKPLDQWSSFVNPYKCKKFKQALNRNLRNAFIKHKISVSSKNGYWSTYLGKQISHAIFQKIINYHNNYDNVVIRLLDIPTHNMFGASKSQIPDFTDKIKQYFLSQFTLTNEGDTIDINTTDHAIVNALDVKFMQILVNIVSDVDFIDSIVKRIDDKYVNDDIVRKSQERIAIKYIVPPNSETE